MSADSNVTTGNEVEAQIDTSNQLTQVSAPEQQGPKKNQYEVVFFARYNNRDSRYVPTVDDVKNFFSKFGTVDRVDYKNDKNIAYVYMTKLATTQTFLRTRSTITNMIAEMTPETKFYVSVARSSKSHRSNQSNQSNQLNQSNRSNRFGTSNTPNRFGRFRRNNYNYDGVNSPRNNYHNTFSPRNNYRTQNYRPNNTDRHVVDLTVDNHRNSGFRSNRRYQSHDNYVDYTNNRRTNYMSTAKKTNKSGLNIRPVQGFTDNGRNRRPSPRSPENVPKENTQPEVRRVKTYRPVNIPNNSNNSNESVQSTQESN